MIFNMECEFCLILKNNDKIIYQDDQVFAFEDIDDGSC